MWWIYAIGFLAQAFFSARILIQWVKSEMVKKVVSPASYWICSLIGSWLLFFYGWLRFDFAIILGQFLSYYIYIWNLRVKGIYRTIPGIVKWILLLTPVVVVIGIACNFAPFYDKFMQNDDIPLWLLLFGVIGQTVFALRFLYQWYYSWKRNRSILPAGFWLMSVTGSVMILIYAIIRHDPVLIVGQSFGLVAYIRNLEIGKKSKLDMSKKAIKQHD